MNSLKRGEGVPLLNFVGGPGVPLLNFRGVQFPTFKHWGGSQVPGTRGPGFRGPGPTFTPWQTNDYELIFFFTSGKDRTEKICTGRIHTFIWNYQGSFLLTRIPGLQYSGCNGNDINCWLNFLNLLWKFCQNVLKGPCNSVPFSKLQA